MSYETIRAQLDYLDYVTKPSQNPIPVELAFIRMKHMDEDKWNPSKPVCVVGLSKDFERSDRNYDGLWFSPGIDEKTGLAEGIVGCSLNSIESYVAVARFQKAEDTDRRDFASENIIPLPFL